MSVLENRLCIVKSMSSGIQLPVLNPSLFFTPYVRRLGKPVYNVLTCKMEMMIKVHSL